MTLTFPNRDLVQGYCTPVSTSNLKVKSKQMSNGDIWMYKKLILCVFILLMQNFEKEVKF